MEEALNGGFAKSGLIPFLLLLLVGKFVLTIFSYGSGAPGGIFAPLLGIGALVGVVCEQVLGIIPNISTVGSVSAAAGMAAMFTGVVRAPLTGLVLLLEMTANYEQLFMISLACLCSYVVAEILREEPIYEALLRADLSRGTVEPHKSSASVLFSVIVEPHSYFDNRKVSEIQIGGGFLIVLIRRGTLELVPSGSTILLAGDELTVGLQGEQAGVKQRVVDSARQGH